MLLNYEKKDQEKENNSCQSFDIKKNIVWQWYWFQGSKVKRIMLSVEYCPVKCLKSQFLCDLFICRKTDSFSMWMTFGRVAIERRIKKKHPIKSIAWKSLINPYMISSTDYAPYIQWIATILKLSICVECYYCSKNTAKIKVLASFFMECVFFVVFFFK